MKKRLITIIFILLYFYTNIAYSFDNNSKASVHIVTKNIGSKDIINAYTKFGKHTVSCGILLAGLAKTWIHYPHPISGIAKVYFKFENGEEIERVVELKQNLNNIKSDDITIVININTNTNNVHINTHDGLVAN